MTKPLDLLMNLVMKFFGLLVTEEKTYASGFAQGVAAVLFSLLVIYFAG